jgi:hypothetical protein
LGENLSSLNRSSLSKLQRRNESKCGRQTETDLAKLPLYTSFREKIKKNRRDTYSARLACGRIRIRTLNLYCLFLFLMIHNNHNKLYLSSFNFKEQPPKKRYLKLICIQKILNKQKNIGTKVHNNNFVVVELNLSVFLSQVKSQKKLEANQKVRSRFLREDSTMELCNFLKKFKKSRKLN